MPERRIVSEFIAGPAGRLEALLEEPEHGPPTEIALVCHPHPRHGGTMHNKVVYRLARGLRHAGAVVLRFNYRGVNLSEGVYDNGIGETEDARAALNWLRGRYPGLPHTLAGFSFGSRIVLRLGCVSSGARRIIAAGFPTIYRDLPGWQQCLAPRIFIHSTNDHYGPREELQAFFDTLPEPKQLHWVESSDHFFTGALGEFERLIASL